MRTLILVLSILIVVSSQGFSQEMTDLELKIRVSKNEFEIYKKIKFNAFLVNNSSKAIKLFRCHVELWCPKKWSWLAKLNGVEVPFEKSEYRPGFHEFSSKQIYDILPGDSLLVDAISYQPIAGGNYTIEYKMSQSSEDVNVEYASSTSAANEAKKINSLSLSSLPYEFSIEHDSQIIEVSRSDITEEDFINAKTFRSFEEAFANPSQVYKLKVEGIINDKIMSKICQLKNLRELTLNVNGIKKLPKELGELKLNKLVIRDSELEYPETMKSMSSLRVLTFTALEFSVLPEWVTNLDNLETLLIYNCPIKELPKRFVELKSLKSLVLSKVNIKTLGMTIANLPQLENLEISYDSLLTDFPDVSNCKKLKTLTISHCNELLSVPPFIGNLLELEELVLKSTKIESLPEEMAQLKKLKRLKVIESNLTHLSSAIYKCSALEYLNVARNQINSCGSGIKKLKNLERIYLQFNQLEQLPKSLAKCKKLNKINVFQNQIKSNDKVAIKLKSKLGENYENKFTLYSP